MTVYSLLFSNSLCTLIFTYIYKFIHHLFILESLMVYLYVRQIVPKFSVSWIIGVKILITYAVGGRNQGDKDLSGIIQVSKPENIFKIIWLDFENNLLASNWVNSQNGRESIEVETSTRGGVIVVAMAIDGGTDPEEDRELWNLVLKQRHKAGLGLNFEASN